MIITNQKVAKRKKKCNLSFNLSLFLKVDILKVLKKTLFINFFIVKYSF